MEKNTKRLRKTDLEKDVYTLNAIQGIADYAPMNQEYSVASLLTLQEELLNEQRLKVQKEGELKAARDHIVELEHRLHNAILAAKDNVRAQFGTSSDEYQSIGLKKKTEYKDHKRKKA